MNEVEVILRNTLGNLILENSRLQATIMQLQKEIKDLAKENAELQASAGKRPE